MTPDEHEITIDGMTYRWTGWQPNPKPVVEDPQEPWQDVLIGRWWSMDPATHAWSQAIAYPQDNDTLKAQKKENALNSLRDRIQHPEQYQFLDSNS